MELFGEEVHASVARGAVTKGRFAEMLGVTPGRVSQLIKMGLPVTESGRIHPEIGRRWYDENVAPTRRKNGPGGAERAIDRSPRRELDRIRAETAELRLRKEMGELVDRREAERRVFELARRERDGWLAWTHRAAAAIAGDTGADMAAVFGALDREVRGHLETLADAAMAVPAGEAADADGEAGEDD